MQCPACGARCGPEATTACDSCGVTFDLDATGFGALPIAAAIDPDVTFGGAPVQAAPPAADAAGAQGPLSVGASFGGRYHIIKMLGMGGMGAVYQAWDTELEVALALKVIRRSAAEAADSAAEIERRFKQELLLARLVTHPNVVRIHDLGEFGGIKYITMPYIQGTDLADVLAEKQTLPVRETLQIGRQIAAGLRAAHEAGVVHRDLKPANVMIDRDGHALITDFGIARGSSTPATEAPVVPGSGSVPFRNTITDAHTQLGTIVGSIEYMAPEQARGEQVDQRADIYAFGLILHRMLVGQRFLPGATDLITNLRARMTAEPERLRQIDNTIPEAMEALVSRCVQPDPAARFQTTGELVAALNRLDEDGNLRPLPIQLLKSVRFWTAAAAATIAIVATTWFIADRPPPPEPDPVAVLIADFRNTTGETVFDGAMEQAVTVGIEGASFITALPRRDAQRIGRRIKAGEKLDESTARLVALSEGIKVVLLGAIEKRGNGYALSMEGIDPSSRNVLFATTASARDRNAVLQAGGTLAARVRSSLGDTRAVDPKETLSTSSLEAVSAYTRAQELSAAGKDQEASEYFRKATSIDPGFGRAYGGLAMSETRLGRHEEADTQWKEALKRVELMSEREQYRLLGAYYWLVTRNREKARDTYETLVRKYPADGAGHNNLAVAYFRALQFDKALAEAQEVRRIYPSSPLYRTNYALFAMYAGNFDLAAEEAQKVAAEGVESYDTYVPLAVAALSKGDLAGARAAYAAMAKKDASGASLAATGLADLELSQGRAAEAIGILHAGIKADRAEENLTGVANKEIVLADAYGMQGDTRAAAAAVRRALEIDPGMPQAVPGTRWLIAAKDWAAVEQLAAENKADLELEQRAYRLVIAAQLALARGKPVEALDGLRKALTHADLWLVRYYLGQAYFAAGAAAEAFSEFEACRKRRGEGYAVFLDEVPTARMVAPVTEWIGRARDGMGLARTGTRP
jgi:serine/threonine protein kinase/tetratricopeptide (TPR) repeat protein